MRWFGSSNSFASSRPIGHPGWCYQSNKQRIEADSPELTIAGHFLHLLHGKAPSELHERAMDVSLILYAEHEFNASTFAARITASTLSDFYSAITSAISVPWNRGKANPRACIAADIRNEWSHSTPAISDTLSRSVAVRRSGA